MLRLFRDSVYIALYPGAAVLARVKRGPRGSIEAHHAQDQDTAGRGDGLDALAEALRDRRWHDAQATVLVSNSLVRYSLVPPSDELVTTADERDFALHRVTQVHGGSPHDWEVRLGHPLQQLSQPVAAFAAGYLERLKGILASARLRADSIQPFFMQAWNRSCASIRDDSFWFANAEAESLLLARVEHGAWSGLTVTPISGSPIDALGARIREDRLIHGISEGRDRVYLYAPAFAGLPGKPTSQFDLIMLSGPTAGRLPDVQKSLSQVLGI